MKENNRWERNAPARSLWADAAAFAQHRGGCCELAPPGPVVSPCRAPQGSSRDSPSPSITSSRGSPTPASQVALSSPLHCSAPAVSSPHMPCTRPCWGSRSSCLHNPGIATSVSKSLPWLLPLTHIFAMENSWMLCPPFFPSLQTSQSAGATSCPDPASQTGHGISPSFSCCCL